MGTTVRVPARCGKGDQVLRKSRRDQIGCIADEPKLLAGEYWYKGQFGGGIAKKVQKSDLELYGVTLAGDRQNAASNST